MKKVGPLSLDLVVACAIYEFNKKEREASFSKITSRLYGIVARSTVHELLESLAYYGIVESFYGVLSNGRNGRMYFITSEAMNVIRETYELFWERVLEKIKT